MASETHTKTYRRGTAANDIYAVLRDEILTLTLDPGSPMDETSLSKRFSVSRSPIREVLQRLTSERLARTLPNRTTIVAPVDLKNFPFFIQALDVQQRLATRLAAKNRSDADVSKLRELADAFNNLIEDVDPLEIMQANYLFHVAVAEAGDNPYVTRQYRELLSEARRLLHIHVQFLDAVDKKYVLRDQHHNFVDAIEAGDIEAADVIAHTHTMQFHDRFLKALRYTPDGSFEFKMAPSEGVAS